MVGLPKFVRVHFQHNFIFATILIYYDRSTTPIIISFSFSFIMTGYLLPVIITVTFITKMAPVNLL